jgi:hypothetical protein
MAYLLAGIVFLLAAAVCFLWTAVRRQEPDAGRLPSQDFGAVEVELPGVVEMSLRKRHLFSCYLAGNDAFPSNSCPFEECTPERAEWIAGWLLAAKGIRIDGREKREQEPETR